jgi:hypothetical protein
MSPVAKQYVDAMAMLHSVDDNYGLDAAVEVVARFVGVGRSWRGATALRIRVELKGILAAREGARVAHS